MLSKDNNYIEPITDTKILKLGFGSMALYREKKPKMIEDCHGSLLLYKCEIGEFEQSRIAYLKEPEFKAGEVIYWKGEQYIIESIEGNYAILSYPKNPNIDPSLFPLNELSHYYPGQEYDGEIKYVRKVKLETRFFNNPPHYIEFEWQEVEEPAEAAPNRKAYTEDEKQLWVDDLKEWRNDYNKFQEGVNNGEILGVI